MKQVTYKFWDFTMIIETKLKKEDRFWGQSIFCTTHSAVNHKLDTQNIDKILIDSTYNALVAVTVN